MQGYLQEAGLGLSGDFPLILKDICLDAKLFTNSSHPPCPRLLSRTKYEAGAKDPARRRRDPQNDIDLADKAKSSHFGS